MRFARTRLSVAIESIDFQSDAFFKELVAIFKELMTVRGGDMADHEAALQLPSLINHYTGLNMQLAWWEDGFMVSPPMVTKNHPLLARWGDYYRSTAMSNEDGDKLIADAKNAPIGRVNIKDGRVSGAFGAIPVTIYLSTKEIAAGKLSAEELAAKMLHEIGHLITYFLLISRTLSTNLILAGISKKLDQTIGPKDREAMLVKVKSAAQLTELDAEALAQCNDKKVIEVVVVSSIAKAIESEIGSSFYDINSCEMLADQYATRMGAGRHLVTALDKSRRNPTWRSADVRYRSTMSYLVIEAYKLLLLAAGPFTFGTSWLLLLIRCASDSRDASGAYDNDINRMGRIRDQIIEAMKDKRLSAEQQSSYAEDLIVIDDIKAFASNRQQLLGYVYDFISPVQRRRISQEKLQRELESIASNDLFAKAASLRQLGA